MPGAAGSGQRASLRRNGHFSDVAVVEGLELLDPVPPATDVRYQVTAFNGIAYRSSPATVTARSLPTPPIDRVDVDLLGYHVVTNGFNLEAWVPPGGEVTVMGDLWQRLHVRGFATAQGLPATGAPFTLFFNRTLDGVTESTAFSLTTRADGTIVEDWLEVDSNGPAVDQTATQHAWLRATGPLGGGPADSASILVHMLEGPDGGQPCPECGGSD